MKFSHLKGQLVLIRSPYFGGGKRLLRAKLIDVDEEARGIWLEETELTAALISSTETQAAKRPPMLFLPFHCIELAIATFENDAHG